MLVMPDRVVQQTLWDAAKNKEMEHVATLHGKTEHLWKRGRGISC